MQSAAPEVIIIAGPTGSGKTQLSTMLAEQHGDAEIINADTGQFYKTFKVGTAKPDWELGKEKYHLFDLLDKPEVLSSAKYRNLVEQALVKMKDTCTLSLVVGGTLFYIKSLLFKQNYNAIQPVVRGEMGAIDLEAMDKQSAWHLLHQIDPQRAKVLNSNDVFRVKRALKIIQEKNVLPSSMIEVFAPVANAILTVVFLNPPLDELKSRISTRLKEMLRAKAWQQEVEKVVGTEWEEFFVRHGLLGYKEMVEFCQSDEKDLVKLEQKIYKCTVAYAKRQVCFWQSLKKTIQAKAPSVQVLEFSDLRQAEHELVKKISQ